MIVISSLKFGGAETQAIAQARELARRGHAVTLYALNRDNPRQSELDGSGVRFIADQKRWSFDPAVLWRLRRYLLACGADVVQGFLFDGNFYARLAAAGTGLAVLSSERSDNYRFNRAQRLGHWLTRRLARGVIANSHAGCRFAQSMYPLPPEHLHVVWNGIDLAAVDRRVGAAGDGLRSALFGPEPVKIACMVANIKPAKDYLLALRVADELTRRDPAWRVLFVGDSFSEQSAYHRQVRQLYEELGLQQRVRFAGHRPDVLELLSRSDVMFSTSFNEGFPNVVLEAMAAGTPVVSTAYSDIRLILPQAWQVVGERAAPALADAIERAWRERAELAPLQRRWVEQHATLATLGASLQGLYQRYAQGGR
ncbi:MAG: glycosyltransferase [Pseudomonadota bacterium]